MTDENTRLPSDSVVEAWTWQESWPCTAGGNNKLLTKVALEKPDPAMLYVLPETIRPLAALAAQPRDDVRELLREARSTLERAKSQFYKYAALHRAKGTDDGDMKACTNASYGEDMADAIGRIDTALSQGDEQPAIPDMTDAECATAYRDLRKRANDAGFATVGEWIDEQPDTDGLAGELAAMRIQGQREGKAAVCAWLRHFTAIKPASEGAEKVAALADMFERSEQAYSALEDEA